MGEENLQYRKNDSVVHVKSCERIHESLNVQLESIILKIDSLNKKLYQDNGDTSVQTKIKLLEVQLKTIELTAKQLEESLCMSVGEIKDEVIKIREKQTSLFKNILDYSVRIVVVIAAIYSLFAFLHGTVPVS